MISFASKVMRFASEMMIFNRKTWTKILIEIENFEKSKIGRLRDKREK